MTYAVVVAQVRLEGALAELHVVDVHQGLELADALRLMAERPPGTIGHLRRLPVDDLPEPGAVVRLEAESRRWRGTPATNGVAARRERRQRALGGKA